MSSVPTGRIRGTPLVVAVVAVVLASAYTLVSLAAFEWNPSIFVAVGEDAPPAAYVSELLGSDVDMREGPGHDGQYFFVLANDPLLLDPEVHASAQDRPTYRSQRMLFPLIAGGFGLLSGWAVAWSLLGLSVLTFGLGTYATALVSQGMGGSAWWGLAFGLNIGVVSELLVGGGGHVALALGMAAIAALQRGRISSSVGFLVLAALTREALLIFVAGVAVWLWLQRERRLAAVHLAVPTAAVAAWAAYVRFRLGSGSGIDEVEEFGIPFVGLIDAVRLWSSDVLNLAVGVVVVVLLVMFGVRFMRRQWLIGWAALGFVPVALLLTRQVWFSYFDITRAVSPVITAYLLMAFAAEGEPGEASGLGRRV